MQRPIRSMLTRVSARMSLHMPAAQGRAPLRSFLPYRLDTTELPVTDNLYCPQGAIAQAERFIAASAGTQTTVLVPGGATAGLYAMLLYACKRGGQVVLPRNAHISCLHLCALAGIEPIFAEPSLTAEGRLYTTPLAYARALDAHPLATAALALHGDYYGLLADLPAIAREVHARSRLLLCDEAHGAYFNWRKDVPNAGACGADLFVQSAHKTLPALTPGAWLHAMSGVDAVRLRNLLRMVQTSSPSFLIMLSLDDARQWMDRNGEAACAKLMAACERFRQRVAPWGFGDGQLHAPQGLAYDRLRLVITCPWGGAWLQKQLQARGLDVEMCDAGHVVCILGLIGGVSHLRRLEKALRAIAKGTLPSPDKPEAPLPALFPENWPPRRMPMGEAAFVPSEEVPFTEAIGRVCAVNAGPYPPGIAWLTPGDEVTPAVAAMIANTPAELLFGLETPGKLRCVILS